MPVPETGELFAAIVRRAVKVGTVGLIVALLPSWLLWRQNALIAAQNKYFQDQNSKLQGQLDAQSRAAIKQEADTLLIRRNELLRTIYELKACEKTSLPEGDPCPPQHPIRLRQEAVLTLAQLDRGELDLSGANLSGVGLSTADFTDVDFSSANLARTAFCILELRWWRPRRG